MCVCSIYIYIYKYIFPLTCSQDTLLCSIAVVVLHSHWWNHHCPDTVGTPALHCRGRQRSYHGSQSRAVDVVAIIQVTVVAVATWGDGCVGRGGTFHCVTATLVSVVLRHAEKKRLCACVNIYMVVSR